MTNVKLKLMFFLLNALLTADIVHARPYSDLNSTDIVIKFSNKDTFIPVDSNSDTLIVANDETTPVDKDPKEESEYSEEDSYRNENDKYDNERHFNGNYRGEDDNEDSNRRFQEEHYMSTDSKHVEEENYRSKDSKHNDERHYEEENYRSKDSKHDDERHYEEENYRSKDSKHDDDGHYEEVNYKTDDDQDSDSHSYGDNEKPINISKTLLEDIIDAETNRDEQITDLFFRPDSEFADDIPRFEFLIAGKINESDFGNKSVKSYSDNSLDRNSSDVMKKMDYVELVEVVKASKENRSAYTVNITGHEVDNDLAPDTSFTDLQTLFLACFGTLLPLLAVLFATLLIRCMCRRWCPGFCKKPMGSTASESSEKQDTNHQQLKLPADESTNTDAVASGEAPPANGSIFTMTLKNNHLIVETEERNDITRNGRETKMKYSPDNDGIFVVEVQQSAAYRPSNKPQHSPPHDPQISTNQALIHRVPEDLEKKIIEGDSERSFERDRALALSSTGLSISDLSMSSIGSHNASYSYGSQLGYEQGPFGYPVYPGYDITKEDIPEGITYDNSREPLISKTPTDPDKPVVTAAIFKQDSIIGNDLQGPGYSIEGSTDGPLLSDVQAREVSLQHLQDQRDKKIENGVAVAIAEKIESPKKSFNRADSLPVRLDEDKESEEQIQKFSGMETITEDDYSKDSFKGKRASLPMIRTDVYESMKDVIMSGSPKFEKLMNDVSPCDSTFDSPPMITITEESESSKSDGTS